MQRILYLSRGGGIGGSQRQLYHVIKNLDKNLYEPVVVCRKHGDSCDRLQAAGVSTQIMPLRPWRSFPTGLLRYFDAAKLAEFARQHHVSLIHSSDLWLSGYLTFTARHLAVPSVLHIRTPLNTECVRKHRCKNADSLIAISRRVKNNLLAAGMRHEKITVINDSVDIDAFNPATSRHRTLKKQYPNAAGIFIGIVGRIDSFKRQLDFLRAAKHIIHHHKRKATFFIIGNVHSQSCHQEVLAFIRDNDLQRHVILTGQRDDMPEVLGSLDILVSLSGGSVMFEAMATAKPVISAGFSTKENSVHIQNGRTGLLITSKSNEKLVNATLRLIDSPDLRRYLGAEAHKWAQDNFSHLNMAIKTQMLYEKVLTAYNEKTRPVPTPIPQHSHVT